jgi:hypothetical protein
MIVTFTPDQTMVQTHTYCDHVMNGNILHIRTQQQILSPGCRDYGFTNHSQPLNSTWDQLGN